MERGIVKTSIRLIAFFEKILQALISLNIDEIFLIRFNLYFLSNLFRILLIDKELNMLEEALTVKDSQPCHHLKIHRAKQLFLLLIVE